MFFFNINSFRCLKEDFYLKVRLSKRILNVVIEIF
jgi:hypothetical protein